MEGSVMELTDEEERWAGLVAEGLRDGTQRARAVMIKRGVAPHRAEAVIGSAVEALASDRRNRGKPTDGSTGERP